MGRTMNLSHTRWECKYRVVFIPKYRRKILFGHIRQELGPVLRQLAEWKESRIEEGHLMPDHVHIMISIPPKYAVSQLIGYIKGKSAIHIARTHMERRRNYVGQHFWARGHFASTGWSRRASDSGIHTQSGEERSAGGPAALGLAPSGASRNRLPIPSSPLSAAHNHKAPGFAGRYLLSFGSPLAGSQALAGELTTDDLHSLCNQAGDSMHALATRLGCRPDDLPADRLRSGAVKAMLELHIEQAPVLEAQGLAVGVVEAIAGSENHRIRLFGTANHAGNTPMTQRRDALAAAAEIVQAVERLASDTGRSTTVATVGRIDCQPNAANVIPGFVELSLDVRDVSREYVDTAVTDILNAARSIAARRGLEAEFVRTGRSAPRPLAPAIIERIAALADASGTPYRRMHSGALHDAATLTALTDVGMIFVPSRGGLSHTPEESTSYADIEPGANLLLATLHALAAADGRARL